MEGDEKVSNGSDSLSGPGGSGLVRLKPSHAKLKPKQEPALGKTSKKSFTPNISSGHRIKREHVSAEVKPIVTTKQFSKDKGKRREKKGIIKSESIFSMGPAQKNSQGRDSDLSANVRVKKPVSRVSSEVRESRHVHIPQLDEDEEQIVGPSKSALDTFQESTLPPSHLPLNQSTSHKTLLNLLDPTEPTPKDDYLFLQLPDCLPLSEQHSTSDTANNSDSVQEGDRRDLCCVPEGHIGKLRIHHSGKVSLALGEVSLDVSMGTPCGFLQELVCVRTEPPHLKMTSLGHVSQRAVCTPNFDDFLTT